jgi:pyruvate/oxaloacetate carboxyltransferase
MKKRKLLVRDLTLRDGQQSLFATRMPQAEIERVLPLYKKANFYAVEVWGGAVPDSIMRYLDEDPWYRLESIKEALGDVSYLTALSRGRNLFGYSPYPEAVIKDFNTQAIKSGLGIMRIFDCLNDINNMKTTIKYVKAAGGIADCAVCFTVDSKFPTKQADKDQLTIKNLPEKIFDIEYFVSMAKELEALGADIISLKDMAGLASPKVAAEIIRRFKQELTVPVDFHSHSTPGYGLASALAAIINGVDIIDTNIMNFAGASAAPAYELIYLFCQKLDIELDGNAEVVVEINKILKDIRMCALAEVDSYKMFPIEFDITKDKLPAEIDRLFDEAIKYAKKEDEENLLLACHAIEKYFNFPAPNEQVKNAEIPGGMYTNMLNQLKALGLENLLGRVLEVVPIVRLDCGCPPLVTPSSQIVGVQAVNCVIDENSGRPFYTNVSNQFLNLVKGEYGKTPIEISPEFREKITGHAEEMDYDVSKYESPVNPVLKEFANVSLAKDDKEYMLLELFPQVATKFLKKRRENEFLAKRAENKIKISEERAAIKRTGKLKIRDLTLRDGQQSLFATRVPQAEIEKVLPLYKEANFYAMEVWGGAIPDSVMRYLNEDPWYRLESIKEVIGDVSYLTALSRGRNLFGYSPYPESIIEGFNKNAIKSGLGIMRIFDCLNDVSNMESTIKYVKQAGGIADCAVCYTVDPKFSKKQKFKAMISGKKLPKDIFNIDYFIDKAKQMEALGADMITVKDMAGLIPPSLSGKIIKRLKQEVKVPIDFHTHCTPGYGLASVLMAMIAGVDIVDANILNFAGGPAAPAFEFVQIFADKLGLDTGVNLEAVVKINKELEGIRKRIAEFDSYKMFPIDFDITSDYLPRDIEDLFDKAIELARADREVELLTVCHRIEKYFNFPEPNQEVKAAEIPGGMYTNMLAQLKTLGLEALLPKVLLKVPEVRVAAGCPPLVTPSSQIVGVQAVNYILDVNSGKKPYTNVNNQYANLVKGEYGKTPVEIDPDFRQMICGQREATDYDVSKYKAPENPVLNDLGHIRLAVNEKEELLLALFPQVATNYLMKLRSDAYYAKLAIEEEKLHEKNAARRAAFLAMTDDEKVDFLSKQLYNYQWGGEEEKGDIMPDKKHVSELDKCMKEKLKKEKEELKRRLNKRKE